MLRRQVRHQDVLANRRAGAGTRDVRAPAVPVDDSLALMRQDRLAAEHVALLAGPRSVVVDRERAQDGGRLLLTMPEVRFLADEVLVLYAGCCHARFDDVVLGLELVAVRAVALLQASGCAVHAYAAGREAVGLPGLPQLVPQLQPLVHRNVQLPSEVAYVRDPRGEHAQRPGLDRAARAE